MSTEIKENKLFDNDNNIFFSNLKDDQIKVFVISSPRDRKLVYNYLDNFFPKVPKTGLKCPDFPNGDIKMRFTKCYGCGHKRVRLTRYVPGVTENNQDEAYVGDCPDCGHSVWYECNYDDWEDLKLVFGNNCIAIGKFFQHYQRPSHARKAEPLSSSMMTRVRNILSSSEVFEIDAPAKLSVSKKNMGRYIATKIKEISESKTKDEIKENVSDQTASDKKCQSDQNIDK